MPGREIRGKTVEWDPNQEQEDQSNKNEKALKKYKRESRGKAEESCWGYHSRIWSSVLFVFFLEAADAVNRKAEH